jgi:hypothetical protein
MRSAPRQSGFRSLVSCLTRSRRPILGHIAVFGPKIELYARFLHVAAEQANGRPHLHAFCCKCAHSFTSTASVPQLRERFQARITPQRDELEGGIWRNSTRSGTIWPTPPWPFHKARFAGQAPSQSILILTMLRAEPFGAPTPARRMSGPPVTQRRPFPGHIIGRTIRCESASVSSPQPAGHAERLGLVGV